MLGGMEAGWVCLVPAPYDGQPSAWSWRILIEPTTTTARHQHTSDKEVEEEPALTDRQLGVQAVEMRWCLLLASLRTAVCPAGPGVESDPRMILHTHPACTHRCSACSCQSGCQTEPRHSGGR